MRSLRYVLVGVTALVVLVAVPGHAQTWPTKPVRIVVTFPPGGSSDVVARHTARCWPSGWASRSSSTTSRARARRSARRRSRAPRRTGIR